MKVIERALTYLEKALMWMSSATMLAIMAIMVLDVAMRYMFNAPLHWAYEVLTRYLLVALFFFSVSSVLRQGEHLVVDLLSNWIPSLVRHALLSVLFLGTAIVWILAFRMTWATLVTNWTGHELIPGIQWPVWTSTIIILIGLLVLILRTCLITFGHAQAVIRPHSRSSRSETSS